MKDFVTSPLLVRVPSEASGSGELAECSIATGGENKPRVVTRGKGVEKEFILDAHKKRKREVYSRPHG